jgi:hypothetical protein
VAANLPPFTHVSELLALAQQMPFRQLTHLKQSLQLDDESHIRYSALAIGANWAKGLHAGTTCRTAGARRVDPDRHKAGRSDSPDQTKQSTVS